MQTETYTPEWISEESVCRWLGINKSTLFRWRTSKGFAWSNVDGRCPMYDRKQINELLNKNSTYAVLNEKKLTAVELTENFYT